MDPEARYLKFLFQCIGVPIDSVGGTSMGALIGALYAERGDIVGTTQRARDACKVS